MNPPDQPTQPSETHKQLAADVFRMVHNRNLTAAAQLIADSEARAVDGAMRDTPWAANYIDMERELAETERLRFGADADRRRLRAEVERWKTVAAQMTAEREHNANEASRLRAELQAKLAAMKDTPTL
jgi:hypothetical protein